MPPVTVAIPTPLTMPSVCDTATQPPTTPRCATGTWSGTVAVSAANIALSAACARHQPTTITATESATASSSSARAPATAPPATHGTRRPKRDVVRSDSAPNSGLATTDTAEPRPVTSPKTNSLSPGATASACWASSTWIGPKKPAQTPSPASVTRATHERGDRGDRDADREVGGGCRQGRPGRSSGRAAGAGVRAAITSRYQPNESLRVRRCVS